MPIGKDHPAQSDCERALAFLSDDSAAAREENPADFDERRDLACLVLRATRIVPPVRSNASGRRMRNMRLNWIWVNRGARHGFLLGNFRASQGNWKKHDASLTLSAQQKLDANMVLDLELGIS
jgi:hypothetical protein